MIFLLTNPVRTSFSCSSRRARFTVSFARSFIPTREPNVRRAPGFDDSREKNKTEARSRHIYIEEKSGLVTSPRSESEIVLLLCELTLLPSSLPYPTTPSPTDSTHPPHLFSLSPLTSSSWLSATRTRYVELPFFPS